MNDLLARLRLALRVLCGKPVMYRVKAAGTFELDVGQGAHVVECEFKPSSWQMVVEKGVPEDGSQS